MKAILLAGGKGTRLAPYTAVIPKPLMPIGEKSILEIVIRQLAHFGFKDITLAVGYLAELLMAYCGDGSKFGVHITYSREEQPLGTAGPIALVPGLDETFLVMNGDLLTTMDFQDMWKFHRRLGAIATLAAYPREVKIDLGVIEVDRQEWVTNYIEKPIYEYLVSTGMYIFEPEVLQYVTPNERQELPDLILKLMQVGQKVSAYQFNGYWLDVGRHDDYETAVRQFAENERAFLHQD